MSAKVIPFPASAAVDCLAIDVDATESPAQLQAALDRLDQLDHDLQVQAYKISLSIGEVRSKRIRLLKRLGSQRSA